MSNTPTQYEEFAICEVYPQVLTPAGWLDCDIRALGSQKVRDISRAVWRHCEACTERLSLSPWWSIDEEFVPVTKAPTIEMRAVPVQSPEGQTATVMVGRCDDCNTVQVQTVTYERH